MKKHTRDTVIHRNHRFVPELRQSSDNECSNLKRSAHSRPYKQKLNTTYN